MSAADEEIARSHVKLSKDDMERLYDLSMVQPWLEKKQKSLIDTWMVCGCDEEKNLMFDLMNRFFYADSHVLNAAYQQIVIRICCGWGLDPSNSIITTVNRKNYSDSSEAVLWHLKSRFSEFDGWEPINFVLGLANAVGKVAADGSLVLVDEFVGTGSTATKAVKWLRDSLASAGKASVKVYVCCLVSMVDGFRTVEAVADDIFSSVFLNKGIDDFYDDSRRAEEVKNMLRIESELEKKVGKETLPSLGYKKSQSLYAQENGNIPNNVFPIFWWKWKAGKVKRCPLFYRM